MVNYNDAEWVNKFITETLTDEDYTKLAANFLSTNSADKQIIDVLAEKIGYKKLSWGGYVFINEKGEIDEDECLQKLYDNIYEKNIFLQRVTSKLKLHFDLLKIKESNSQFKDVIIVENEL